MNKLVIYAVSDEINVGLKVMKIKMNVYKFNSLEPVDSLEFKFDLQPNAVTLVETLDIYNYLHQRSFFVLDHFMIFYLQNSAGDILAKNFVFPGNFEKSQNVKDPNLRLRIARNKCTKNQHTVDVEVEIDFPAIFVSINLQHEKIKKFSVSKNGFIQVEPIQNVELSFVNPNCELVVTNENLVVNTLNEFMK